MSLVDEVLSKLTLSHETAVKIKSLLQSEMVKGLERDSGSTLKMLPTYVHDIPNGTEEGDFLAIDLGGTNFRVLKISLKDRKYKQVEKKIELPLEIITDTQQTLFGHLADVVTEFIKDNKISATLPLGFTFSFPVKQRSLTSGLLITWTKKFTAEGAVGKDIVELLKAAFDEKQVKVDVVGLVNDTTGTMMACALTDFNCHVGVILGTGTNACYMEQIENIPKWTGDKNQKQVIINMEWGAFGDATSGDPQEAGALAEIRTEFDKELDVSSPNAGKQRYEKMISGMYLGELVRLVLVQLTKKGLIFNGLASDELLTRNVFDTSFISNVEDLSNSDHSKTRDGLSKLKLNFASEDLDIVLKVCQAVSRRGARLAAAGVAAVVEKIKKVDDCVVAVDGSVFQKHPTFSGIMKETLNELLPGNKIQLKRAEDGSGRGAALVAAVAVRMKGKL